MIDCGVSAPRKAPAWLSTASAVVSGRIAWLAASSQVAAAATRGRIERHGAGSGEPVRAAREHLRRVALHREHDAAVPAAVQSRHARRR
jgi:hypothetical protein